MIACRRVRWRCRTLGRYEMLVGVMFDLMGECYIGFGSCADVLTDEDLWFVIDLDGWGTLLG